MNQCNQVAKEWQNKEAMSYGSVTYKYSHEIQNIVPSAHT